MDMAKLSLLPLLLVTAAVAQEKRNTITHIKGFDGPLPFSLETGYVEVEETHGVELFYYFIQSERNPAEDPLILWISGGPGCSGLNALLLDIGPLKLDGYTEEGFPRLVYHEDAYTKVSNIIFLDAPVGTGFSYAREAEGLNVSLTATGRHMWVFLEKWLADHHPELASNTLYLGGDSYGGKIVPVAALEMANPNVNGQKQLNLKGYMVGNPVTDEKYDSGGKVPFMHGMGLISDELYKAALGSCRGDQGVSMQCSNAMQAISTATSDINPLHILEHKPLCGVRHVVTPTSSIVLVETRRMLVQEESKLQGLSMECGDEHELASVIWAADPEVREMLGIRDGSTRSWRWCTDLPHFRCDVGSTVPCHRNLTQRGYRALVYSGDHDMLRSFVGTQAWLTTLGYPVVTPWRPWYSNRQVAGFTTEYAFNLTFATVKGGGHKAPEARPKECLEMLDRWTSSAGRL